MVDRKAFAWNWIINGMIIGLIVIVVFASILSKVYVEEARQSANKQFNEIYSRVNALCSANPGEEMLYSINIPDIVELMYVSKDKKALPDDADAKKKGYDTATASNLCIKFREEPLKCRVLKCKTEMSYIGEKKTVMSLADSILSKPKYVEYPVYFKKGDCGVTVLKDGKCDGGICDGSEMCGYTCTQTAGQACETGFSCTDLGKSDGVGTCGTGQVCCKPLMCTSIAGQTCEAAALCSDAGKDSGSGSCDVGSVCCKPPSTGVCSVSCTPSWMCEAPLNGYEYDGCGNRRLKSACNAPVSTGSINIMGTNHPNLWYNQAEIDKLRAIILGSEPAVKKAELVNIYNTRVKGTMAVNAPSNWFGRDVDGCCWSGQVCPAPACINWKDSYLLALPLGAANMKAGVSYMIEPTPEKAQRIKSAIFSFVAYSGDIQNLIDPQNTGHSIWPLAWLYDLTYNEPGLYTAAEKTQIETFFTDIAGAMKSHQGNGYPLMWKKVQDENGVSREGYENWYGFYAGQGVVLSLVGNDQALLDYFTKGQSSDGTLWYLPTSQGATNTNPDPAASNIRDLYQYVNGMVYPSGKTWDFYVRINDGNKLYHEFSLWGIYLGLEAAAHNGWNGWNENIVNGKPAMRRAIDWQIKYHPILQSGGRYPAGKAAFNIRRFYNSDPIIRDYLNGAYGSELDENEHSYIFGNFGRIFVYPMYDSTTACTPSWTCEAPLNGYEYDGCGNRRTNSACNAQTPAACTCLDIAGQTCDSGASCSFGKVSGTGTCEAGDVCCKPQDLVAHDCTRYISTSGDDAYDGMTLGTAWATLKNSASKIFAGDTLCVVDGTYNDDFFVAVNSGTETSPITIRAYSGTPAFIGVAADNRPLFNFGDYNQDYGAPANVGYYVVDGFRAENYGETIDAYQAAHHLEITNMIFLNNVFAIHVQDGSHDIFIKNWRITNARWAPLHFWHHNHHVTIEDVYIDGTIYDHGIIDFHTNNSWFNIRNVKFTGIMDRGEAIYYHGDNEDIQTNRNNKLSNIVIENTISLDNANTWAEVADIWQPGYNNHFENMYFTSNCPYSVCPNVVAIGQSSPTYGMDDFVFKDSVITQNGGSRRGIYLKTTYDMSSMLFDNVTILNVKSGWPDIELEQPVKYSNLIFRDIYADRHSDPPGVVRYVFGQNPASKIIIEYSDNLVFSEDLSLSSPIYYPTASNLSVIETGTRTITYYPMTARPVSGSAIVTVNSFDTALPAGSVLASFNADTINGNRIDFTVSTLKPSTSYSIYKNAVLFTTVSADPSGRISFSNDAWPSGTFTVKEV